MKRLLAFAFALAAVLSLPAQVAASDALGTRFDFEAAWARPDHGWNDIVAEYRKKPDLMADPAWDDGVAEMASTRPPPIPGSAIDFLTGRLAAAWAESSPANGFKPLRDLIARCYGLSGGAGADSDGGHALLYKAIDQLDRSDSGRVPDYLYSWITPRG